MGCVYTGLEKKLEKKMARKMETRISCSSGFEFGVWGLGPQVLGYMLGRANSQHKLEAVTKVFSTPNTCPTYDRFSEDHFVSSHKLNPNPTRQARSLES